METKERPFSMDYRPAASQAGAAPEKHGGSTNTQTNKKQKNKRSLVMNGRQKAGRSLGEREGQWARLDWCLWTEDRAGQYKRGETDRARFWVKLLKRAPEYSTGKGQGQGQPNDLWLGEQRWGVWYSVYSHVGESWRQLLTLYTRHPAFLTALSH